MRKFLVAQMLCMLFCANVSAQILYSNTFDNGLSGMKVIDVDGNTPNQNVREFDGTWTALSDTRFDEYRSGAAISGSFYTPSGSSDDWLITPQINIPVGTVLTWDALSLDDGFRDSYEILVSTTGDNPEDFTEVIFREAREKATVNTKSVVLNDYVGESIYIAFRNVSNYKFLLIIDNIFVRIPYERDIFVKSLDIGLNYVSSQDAFITLAERKKLSARLLNFGSKKINTIQVEYTLNGQKFEESLTGNLDSGEDMIFESEFLDIPIGNGQILDLDIVSINGQSDQDIANNRMSIDYDGMPETPGYNGTDSKGNSVNTFLDGRDGKSILFYFFSSDCDDCEDAVDKLNQYYLSQGASNGNLSIVGVSVNPEDDNAALNSLGWSATFPLMQYTPYNERLFVHYTKNQELASGNLLPFVVQICSNADNPALSSINSSLEGYDNDDVFNEVFRPEHNTCQLTVTYVESIDIVNDIKLFPNPTGNQEVNLEIDVESAADVTIVLIDMMGRQVQNYNNVSLSTGNNQLIIDTAELSVGTYFVKIQKENQVNSLKLVIVE